MVSSLFPGYKSYFLSWLQFRLRLRSMMAIQHLHSLQHPVQDGAQGGLPEVLSEWKWVSPWQLIKVLWFKRLQLQIHPGRRPLRSSLSMPLMATCKRDTFKSKEQRHKPSVYCTSTQSRCSPLAFSQHVAVTPDSQAQLFRCIWENTGSPLLAPPANVPQWAHAQAHAHTQTKVKTKARWKPFALSHSSSQWLLQSGQRTKDTLCCLRPPGQQQLTRLWLIAGPEVRGALAVQ